ncbi:hypothetical protein SDC9_172635 [bioreactor metagenome]|uniref:Uncharacterized protein n=1 Tax=bioreactor metagenome TaxID=1076179 RepID=A0A645GEA3_9ZZZZ
MLDHEDGEAALVDVAHLVHQLVLLGGVHARHRLVEQQQSRIGGQRARQFQAALFTV